MMDLRCFRYGTIVIISLFFLVCSRPGISHSKDNFIIGLIPEMNVFKQQQRFQPLADYLSEKIGVKVELSMLSRYGNIVQRLKEAKVDAAFLGSFTGALAISQLGVEPLVRPINLNGTSTYHGHIFVRKDSGIQTFEEMRGKTMVFVERATTAGYIFPLAYIKRHGVTDYTTFFNEYFFSGSHDAAVDAVFKGQADIGAAKNTIFDFYMEKNPKAKDEIVILASSPNVPSNGLCVIPTLDKELKYKIKNALLELDTNPKGASVLKKLRAIRFVETRKEDYLPVTVLSSEAEISLKEYQYINR
nr:phosphate/phosphite/phosphonate ABC transporter substrate-binding protein [Desulfobulbaceae bacterium]